MAKAVDDYPWRLKRTLTGKLYSTEKLKVGHLGLVTYEQAIAHETAGVPTHQWTFYRQSGGNDQRMRGPLHRSSRAVITTMRCTVCHGLRDEDARGRPIYR